MATTIGVIRGRWNDIVPVLRKTVYSLDSTRQPVWHKSPLAINHRLLDMLMSQLLLELTVSDMTVMK